MLSYPADLPRRGVERVFVAGAAVIVAGIGSGLVFISLPEWNGVPASARWPTLLASRPLFEVMSGIWAVGCLGCAVGVLVLLRRRLADASGIDRRALIPAVAGTAGAGFLAAVSSAVQVYIATPDSFAASLNLQGIGLLAVPASAAAVLLTVRRMGTDLLNELPQPATPAQVQRALAHALGDPSITVSFPSAEVGGYVDGEGRRVDPSATRPGRLLVPLYDEQGVRWCVIDLVEDLRHHDDQLEAALRAAGLALHNARLQADLKAQLTEVRRSRAALVTARDEGRRQLARDLHDGAQATLLAIPMDLEVLRMRIDDEELRAELQRLKRLVTTAAEEIRGLAEGLEALLLREGGLRPTADRLAETLRAVIGGPVHVDVDEARYPAAVEASAYSVIAESAANATKYAGASRLAIRARASATGSLVVEINDDGRGGADPTGHGLLGLADRVASLGGTLRVHAPARQGTTVRAELPLPRAS